MLTQREAFQSTHVVQLVLVRRVMQFERSNGSDEQAGNKISLDLKIKIHVPIAKYQHTRDNMGN